MKTIHLKNFDLNLLLIFDCIYTHQNLTLAAEELGRTQSALSHALERLRQAFGDPLFVRTARKMRPTPRADSLLPQIKKALSQISTVFSAPDSFAPEQFQHTFTISMSDYCQWVILPKLLPFLSEHAPGIQIEVLSPATIEPQQGLETGLYDLIIGNKDLGSGTFQQLLFTDTFVCLASKQYYAHKKTLSLEEYQNGKHILFTPRGREDRIVDQTLKDLSLQRKIAARIPNVLIIPQIINTTPFLVTLPQRLADNLFSQEVMVLPPPMTLPKLPIMQYWHEALQFDPAHIWFREVIQKLFV